MLIRLLSWIAVRWIRWQYKTFYHLGESLSSEEKEVLLPYFGPEILDRTRKVFLDRIRPPGMGARIRLAVLKALFRLRRLLGLTLIDCVLMGPGLLGSDLQTLRSILFHELVHVTQYDMLGLEEFIRRYLESWAGHRFAYPEISLERVAYGLTHHYQMFPDRPFSVRERALEGLEIR